MRDRLLELLACPDCTSPFHISNSEIVQDEHLIRGTLTCTGCEKGIPVEGGIPRFIEDRVHAQQKTADRFGWQWETFDQSDEKYAEQFLGWINPVEPSFFEGKIVLEGGCGKGRHTSLVHKWGAKDLVAVELGSAADVAFENTRSLPNAHVIQADILNLPLAHVFDYAFSVGVLHHTPNPRKAFNALAKNVKRHGYISAWVYGEENNGWITSIVDPVRKSFTSKLGPNALYHLSKLPTFGVFCLSKLGYRPLNRIFPKASKKLFYNSYMNQISSFGWREQHNIVFDHLVAPTAFYISKEEFEDWFKEVNATDVEITWHNKNSWCGFGKLP